MDASVRRRESRDRARLLPAYWFLVLVWTITLVNDGWSGRPSPLRHQLIVLPFTLAFSMGIVGLLTLPKLEPGEQERSGQTRVVALLLYSSVLAEILSILGFLYERRHFARFGYALHPLSAGISFAVIIVAFGYALVRRTGLAILVASLVSYAAGLMLAIWSFPLNYLRSDMLPVIVWADQRLVAHLNPYTTMHVGTRLYDFPYLPGMLVAFWPAVAAHLDVRWVTLCCVVGVILLMYSSAVRSRRVEAAALGAAFFLSPFLQYRHELYLAPHWITLTAALALAQRRRLIWAAIAFGLSMALYQLSWVLFPFLLLYAFRNESWRGALKVAIAGLLAMLAVVGPFLSSALGRIASNTVGQWSRMPHALADPINLSYWVSYLVRPDDLRWVQLVVMTAIFAYCLLRGKCRSLTDTVRWMSAALALFIALNVLVDGYFYLTLLLLLLVYTCLVSGVWADPTEA